MINPQRMRKGYSTQSCLCVYLLQSQQGLKELQLQSQRCLNKRCLNFPHFLIKALFWIEGKALATSTVSAHIKPQRSELAVHLS